MGQADKLFTDGEAYERLMGRWTRLVGEVFLVTFRTEAEIQQLQRRVAELEALAQQPVVLDPVKQRKFATVASALGLSLRQTEDLFQILLPPGQAPDHSTLGRWVKTEAKRATEVLQVLDQKCATKVQTLALDEIFFGGDRPWSASSRRA